MARYKYTSESGTDFKVNTDDKCDAYESENEKRQILDDIGELLGHSLFNDAYPKDGTSGGDIDIRRVTTKSAVATLTTAEAGFVKVSAAAGYSLTLPTAVGNKLTYIFVKTDANTNLITIDGAGIETINGALTYTDLNYQYAYVAIRSDNANWFVLFRSTNNLVTKTGTLVVGDLVKVNNASGIVEPTGIVAADVVKKTGTFTAGKVAKINNASGIIEMATNTDTEVAAAVTEKHTHPIVDTTGIAKGSADATKIVRLEVDGLTTGVTRVLTVQDKDGTIADTADVALKSNIASPTFTTQITTPTINLTGGQIAFPATQAPSANANTLDDYKEGIFTPAVTFGGGNTGITYSNQIGKYTKIGRVVYIYVYISLTAKGTSTGAALVTGLPFTTSTDGTMVNYQPNKSTFIGQTKGAIISNTIGLFQVSEAGVESQLTDANFTDISQIRVGGFYFE